MLGQATAGETNSMVTIYDTFIRNKKWGVLNEVPPFPTYFPNPENENLPEQLYVDDLHNFNEPTILFKEED